jgi:predicted nucleic acid-binding protein
MLLPTIDIVDAGEAAGIAISKAQDLIFFSGDEVARKVARDKGIKVSGTLGILKVAIEEKMILIDEANLILSKMIEKGYRSPVKSMNDVFRRGLL